ncbi:MAG: hypothetical protein IPG78_08860 [Ignavibacteria bacterium]|nr:hypothetical protein [Ignavibacteria bacterium]
MFVSVAVDQFKLTAFLFVVAVKLANSTGNAVLKSTTYVPCVDISVFVVPTYAKIFVNGFANANLHALPVFDHMRLFLVEKI